MEIAEEEIAAAQKRHPGTSDRLYHSFMLLVPSHERMEYEPVYRSHCRELLDRVAAGGDTRIGTAAEVCCALHDVSLATPLRSSAAGLYFLFRTFASGLSYLGVTEVRANCVPSWPLGERAPGQVRVEACFMLRRLVSRHLRFLDMLD